jgi:hypothetical protein
MHDSFFNNNKIGKKIIQKIIKTKIYYNIIIIYFFFIKNFNKIIGLEHPPTSGLYNNLGILYMHMGKYK